MQVARPDATVRLRLMSETVSAEQAALSITQHNNKNERLLKYHITACLNFKQLKDFISWNNFPFRISLFNTLLNTKDKEDSIAIWLSVPYIDDKTSQLVRYFKRKLCTDASQTTTLRSKLSTRETTKLCFYTNYKDKVPQFNKSHVVYKFSCPGCQSTYIGNTDRTPLIRIHEYATSENT